MKRPILMIVFLAGFLLKMLAQLPDPNNLCENADPFCAGSLYNFPAGVNAGSGQPGPYYACLNFTPNPAWYYMKVVDPGDIIITMQSEPPTDIDFCCWGPFTSQNCCNQLDSPKVVSCSYSPLQQEVCNIPNGQTGEYYMLVITNFSNHPCNIIFSQTGGSGTTDCSILPLPVTNNSPICSGQTLQLSAVAVSNAIYSWWGPNNFTSNAQNPTISNATPINAGVYYLTVSVNGQPPLDTIETQAIIYLPEADAGDDLTIPNGNFTTLYGDATGGSGSYSYHWEPIDKLVDPDVQDPQTVNLFATTLFTLTVTDDSASCQGSDVVTVNITGALTANPTATPSWICRDDTIQLHASASGGNVGFYAYEWSSDPAGFSSTEPNPIVTPVVNTTYSVSVFDGFSTTSGNTTVGIYPQPEISLGDTILLYSGSTVTLWATPDMQSYFWSNGSDSQGLSVDEQGDYWVEVKDWNSCTNSDTVYVKVFEYYIPNAFTPNGDGLNDIFRVVGQYRDINFSMHIYNRWGQLVFQSSDIDQGWDGTFRNQTAESDTYVWILQVDFLGEDIITNGDVVLKGTVTLVK